VNSTSPGKSHGDFFGDQTSVAPQLPQAQVEGQPQDGDLSSVFGDKDDLSSTRC
jgi:hypothetical protein